jgi:hypothetical protein
LVGGAAWGGFVFGVGWLLVGLGVVLHMMLAPNPATNRA